mgnify:FL=1
MPYTVNPQDSQDSVTAALREKFPLIPIIPDGLPEGEYKEIKLNPDSSVKPFIVLWFHTPRRLRTGRSFANTRLDMRQTGVDVVAVANSGSESRRILNGVTDFLINFKPERSGRITESDSSLWSQARPMDISNRPARWPSPTPLPWGKNSAKIA